MGRSITATQEPSRWKTTQEPTPNQTRDAPLNNWLSREHASAGGGGRLGPNATWLHRISPPRHTVVLKSIFHLAPTTDGILVGMRPKLLEGTEPCRIVLERFTAWSGVVWYMRVLVPHGTTRPCRTVLRRRSRHGMVTTPVLVPSGRTRHLPLSQRLPLCSLGSSPVGGLLDAAHPARQRRGFFLYASQLRVPCPEIEQHSLELFRALTQPILQQVGVGWVWSNLVRRALGIQWASFNVRICSNIIAALTNPLAKATARYNHQNEKCALATHPAQTT